MKNLKNNVRLIGNLGRDPELRALESGRSVARVTLATNSNFRNGQGEIVKDTQWHSLIAWGKTAEQMHKILQKGTEVIIDGMLTHRMYEDNNGQTRKISEILVQDFTILSRGIIAAPKPF